MDCGFCDKTVENQIGDFCSPECEFAYFNDLHLCGFCYMNPALFDGIYCCEFCRVEEEKILALSR